MQCDDDDELQCFVTKAALDERLQQPKPTKISRGSFDGAGPEQNVSSSLCRPADDQILIICCRCSKIQINMNESVY